MKEFLQKLRKYEIRIRKAVSGHLQGDYHSVFKGSGLEFDDVRAYQYGDDVRSIDWNVSASQEIGNTGQQKIDISKEICGVLALSAIKEGSQVGLYCFSDRKEKYIKPGKGLRYAYQIISSLYNLKPVSLKTGLSSAIFFALNMLKRRSVIILISDFIDNNYEPTLRSLARRHDLVIVHVYDSRETDFPKLGIVPLFDRELGKQVWINTSSPGFSKRLDTVFSKNKQQLELFCKKHQVNYLPTDTHTDYIPHLIKLFKVRNRSRHKTA